MIPKPAPWRDEFLRLFSSGRPEDVRAAFELKRQNLPASLYKFFAPSEHAFEGLAKDTVWLASPATFNDPFDSGIVMDGPSLLAETAAAVKPGDIPGLSELGLSGSELAKLIGGQGDEALVDRLASLAPEAERKDLRRLLEVLPTILQKVTNDHLVGRMEPLFQHGLKIACFTEHATSLLLWAHYASAHRGFCVEYAFAEAAAHPGQERLLFPVFYSSKRFDVSSALRRLAGDNGSVPNHAILAALHKAEDWAYEQEWRIVNPDGRLIPGYSIQMAPPLAVYAGLRMTGPDKTRLASICSEKGVQLHDVSLSRDHYEVFLPADAKE